MTSRKPKLNLLYVDASSSWLQPRLQLAVVSSGRDPVQRHARQWLMARSLDMPPTHPVSKPFKAS